MLEAFSRRSELPRHVIKVTGTSGKGSVCAMLEAGLRGAGLRTGVFTSPHLVHEGERIRVDGKHLEACDLEQLRMQAADVLAAGSSASTGSPPTFFETMLMLALERFAQVRVEVAVLEVAIGGGTDITSLVPGHIGDQITALTSIGIDHAAEIGPAIADIAQEKAMLADFGSTLVAGPAIEPTAMNVVEDVCRQRHVRVRRATREGLSARSLGSEGHAVTIVRNGRAHDVKLPLAGEHQIDNLATALGVLDALIARGVVQDASRFIAGLEHASWPGRLETLHRDPLCMVDGAHNELAFTRLREFAKTAFPDKNTLLVVGASELDKARAAIQLLGPLFGSVLIAGGFYRSIDLHAAEVRAMLDALTSELGLKISLAQTPATAADAVQDARMRGSRVLITGSLYLVGPVRELLL